MCTRATLAEVRELQKAAGILNENDIDYSLDEMLNEEEGMVKEKMQSPVTDQWCTERYGRPMTAYSCEHAGGWRTCWTAGAPIDWYCDNEKHKPVPVTYMPHEGYNMNEGVTSTTCPPLPDGTKTMAFVTGPGIKDFICAPVTATPTKNGTPLKKVGGPTTPTAPTAPKPGMQAEDAMGGIDEAGNIKGIKIEIPGNSYASDFGKAAAREVIASFTPMGSREFLEAFVEETRKIATARMAARSKAPKAPVTPTVAPNPGMQPQI